MCCNGPTVSGHFGEHPNSMDLHLLSHDVAENPGNSGKIVSRSLGLQLNGFRTQLAWPLTEDGMAAIYYWGLKQSVEAAPSAT